MRKRSIEHDQGHVTSVCYSPDPRAVDRPRPADQRTRASRREGHGGRSRCAAPRRSSKSVRPCSSIRKERASVADASHFAYRPGRLGRRDGSPRPRPVANSRSSPWPASSRARARQRRPLQAAQRAFGVSLPSTPAMRHGQRPRLRLVRAGPLARARAAGDGTDRGARWAPRFGDACRQSSTRAAAACCSNCAVRACVTCSPRACRSTCTRVRSGPGDVAVTTASHLAVHLWQVADDPVYRLLVVRTWFDSLWRWLAASAAEYGCEVLAPPPYASHTA